MDREKLKKLLIKRDAQEAITELMTLATSHTSAEVAELALVGIKRTGCLIEKQPGDLPNPKRKEFTDKFTKFFSVDLNQAEAANELSEHAKDSEAISKCFATILTSLGQAEISKRPIDVQLWAAIKRSCNELTSAIEQLELQWADRQKNSTIPIISDTTIEIDGNLIDVDTVFDAINSNIVSCLKMFSFRHKWAEKGGAITVPEPVTPEADALIESYSLLVLAKTWSLLQSASEELRFFGGATEWRDVRSELNTPEEHWDQVPSNSLVFNVDHGHAKPFLIARKRHGRMLVHWMAQADMETNARERAQSPLSESVSLPPEGLVSIDELISGMALENAFHWPLHENKNEYSGLTILEWVRAYSTIKCLAESLLETDESKGIYTTDQQYLSDLLQRAGLSADKAIQFIKHITFSKDSPDLYDAPLLRDGSGALHFLYQFYGPVQPFHLVTSQFGKLGHQIKSKGNRFEDALAEAFSKHDVESKTFTYTLDNQTFECDRCIVWGDYIFVFECKNYSLPDSSPTLHFYYVERMLDAIKQVKRISFQLKENPSILERQFGRDLQDKEFIPVVLNSMPWSIPGKHDGVYLYDAPALGKFLDDGAIRIISPRKLGDKVNVSRRHQVFSCWSGEGPTPEDLINEMERIIQFQMSKDDWELRKLPSNLGQGIGMVTTFYSPLAESLERGLRAIGCHEGIGEELAGIFEEFDEVVKEAEKRHDAKKDKED